jgi:hypothetical protein
MFDLKGNHKDKEKSMPMGGHKAVSMNNLMLASTTSSPYRPPIVARSTTKTPPLEGAPLFANRKRNANGAMIVGGGGSKLAALSPIYPYNLRKGELANFEEDDDEDDDNSAGGGSDGGREQSASLDPLPALTDSSSVDSSLESHADSTESLPGSSGAFFTPQNYKNVKPLQAAFMSTGLISKRLRHRTDNGEGDAPHFAGPLETEDANGVLKSARLAHPAVAALAGRVSLMPDTPCKRPVLVPSPAWRPTPNLHIARPQQPEEEVEVNNSSSASSSSSPTKPPISGDPGTGSRKTSPFTEAHGNAQSNVGSSSTENSPIAAGKSGRPSLLKRRPLFRRRSSSHLLVNVDAVVNGSKLTAGRGSSYAEPVTPTRIVGDRFSNCEILPSFLGLSILLTWSLYSASACHRTWAIVTADTIVPRLSVAHAHAHGVWRLSLPHDLYAIVQFSSPLPHYDPVAGTWQIGESAFALFLESIILPMLVCATTVQAPPLGLCLDYVTNKRISVAGPVRN